MGTKTIGISEDVYDRLAAEKREDESFTDTIARLIDVATSDWRQGFGRYRGTAGEEFERVVDQVQADHADGFARRQGEVLAAMGVDLDDEGTVVSPDETARREMKVVDATVLVGHARGEPAVGAYLADHADETLVVSAIVLPAFAVGEVADRDESKAAILGNLGGFDVRPFNADHAYHAAVIEAALRETSRYEPALARDVLVGGVARALSVPVVTRNAAHFERFDGVTVETY